MTISVDVVVSAEFSAQRIGTLSAQAKYAGSKVLVISWPKWGNESVAVNFLQVSDLGRRLEP